MENLELLQKPIPETKYLNQENTYRYRPIIRFFYHKYEQAENWLYKEEVYDALKDEIPEYEMEDLERDLEFLVSNLNLTTIQDVKNINSLDDFKFRRYRYQLTDIAIEIERMTISLEELEIKVATLSPKRFVTLKKLLQSLSDINNLSDEEVSDLWNHLINEYNEINQNYQDFLKKFQESKTEELLQSTVFLEYKNKMVQYLRDFISGYLNQADLIKKILVNLPSNYETILIKKLENYQHDIPKINPKFNYQKFNDINLGKWKSLYKWFINPNDKSEGERLLDVTSSIITQITKYANSLIELHGNMAYRKEEYRHICKLFDQKQNLEDARKLSMMVFGIQKVSHYKGQSSLDTDSLVESYAVSTTYISVMPNDKRLKALKKQIIVVDKSKEKKQILEEYAKEEEKRKQALLTLVKEQTITLKDKVYYNCIQREYLLNLISRNVEYEKSMKDPVFGLTYHITKDTDCKCQIISEDGILTLPSITIVFEEAYHG